MRRAAALLTLTALAGAGGIAFAQRSTRAELALAKAQADEAVRRSATLERRAAAATDAAARARANASAAAARIEAAEADITAADARIRIIEALRADQRARLAERQGPLIRLTAALQTMARRPPALALAQPGSIDDVVRVRALLASTLPVIRARTADVRAEIARGDRLRRSAETAYAALVASQRELKAQRGAFARLEAEQYRRSERLGESALFEQDRALAFNEEARDIAARAESSAYRAAVRQNLAALPPPPLRPGATRGVRASGGPLYRLPVEGQLLRGTGEISDGGIHARGLTFAAAPGAAIVAPSGGRVVYAGAFRGYGGVVIIAHGGGWTSTLTNLSDIAVTAGNRVAMGSQVGRARRVNPQVSVELRREGRPVPIAPLLSLG